MECWRNSQKLIKPRISGRRKHLLRHPTPWLYPPLFNTVLLELEFLYHWCFNWVTTGVLCMCMCLMHDDSFPLYHSFVWGSWRQYVHDGMIQNCIYVYLCSYSKTLILCSRILCFVRFFTLFVRSCPNSHKSVFPWFYTFQNFILFWLLHHFRLSPQKHKIGVLLYILPLFVWVIFDCSYQTFV